MQITPQKKKLVGSQLRETILTLYFVDTATGNLKSEGKLIDSLTLVENPYKEITELLLAGPQSKDLTVAFPSNTQNLSATLNGNCVTLDFSSELLNYTDETQKYNIINSILNTLSQLNEVSAIQILVNGSIPDGFNEKYETSTKANL